MTERKKIAIVAGELTRPQSICMFEALQLQCDVTVFALNRFGFIDNHRSGLKVRLFNPIDDMPGYLRGLEDELASFDAIIGIDNSKLSTFQALRAARKFDRPFAVVINEYKPFFYEKYANIRAIQFDVNNKARSFFATSQQAVDTLLLDNVPRESIVQIMPTINNDYFRVRDELRKKFRSYVGLANDDIVFLFTGELEHWTRVDDVVHALKLLKKRNVNNIDRVKLILAGNGSFAKELKYKICDLELGSQVLFVHQDCQPFLADLYNASDVLLAPDEKTSEWHEELPMHVLEAQACGVLPVVGKGNPASEYISEHGIALVDESYQGMSVAMGKILERFGRDLPSRQEVSSAVVKLVDRNEITQTFVSEVSRLFSEGEVDRTPILERIKNVGDLRKRHQKMEALIEIEELLLLDDIELNQKLKLLGLKGEMLFDMGKMEDAMGAFSDSLRLNDQYFPGYRGLGYIAWQGHSNEEALTFFRKALAIKDDPETMLGISLVYRRLGLCDEALYWIEKTIEHDESPRSALVALTQTCLETPYPEQGIESLERVLESFGDQQNILLTLAQLYLRTGDSAKGNEILQRALDLPNRSA